MKTDLSFELSSPIETYEISGLMYHTYYLEVWFGRFFAQLLDGKVINEK